jgi:hypothetical protein
MHLQASFGKPAIRCPTPHTADQIVGDARKPYVLHALLVMNRVAFLFPLDVRVWHFALFRCDAEFGPLSRACRTSSSNQARLTPDDADAPLPAAHIDIDIGRLQRRNR